MAFDHVEFLALQAFYYAAGCPLVTPVENLSRSPAKLPVCAGKPLDFSRVLKARSLYLNIDIPESSS